jgi:alanine dehydrogenase
MSTQEALILTAQDVRNLLTIDECIEAVELAFRLYGEHKAGPPSVLGLHTPGGGFHIKAGVLELSKPYFAAKVNGNFPHNPAQFGLPTIQGVIVLCDAQCGSPLAVMDSRDITSLRTGAATAVAAKYLARRDSRVVTICGCGIQGRVQLKALSRVCHIQSVFAYDKSDEQALSFARALTEELAIPVTVARDLSNAVQKSDICVTCTTSREPLLGLEDVVPGTFIAAVGADNPEKQELQPELIAGSKLVADVLEQCAVIGDLHHALGAGAMTLAKVHAELGEIVAGRKPGRVADSEIIIFDSTGMALQDVAAAAAVYEKAMQVGVGVHLGLAA